MDDDRFETPGLETVDPPVLPIAPMVRVPRKQSGTFVFLFLLAVILGAFAKYLLQERFGAVFPSANFLCLDGAATLLTAVAAVIVLHEAGHLVAAILVNFEILGLALGPLRAVRLHGKWRLRLSPRSFFSGSVSAAPRNSRSWRARMLAVVAAGPLATLLTGSLAASLLLSYPLAGWASTLLGAVIQLSAFIFLLGLIPNSRHALVRNDARLLLLLIRNSHEAREILLYHLLTRLDLDGVRPGDYPSPLMRELALTQSRPDLMLFSAQKIVLWAIDRNCPATADAWDQRCLELSEACQPASRNLALATSACFDVVLRNRTREARDKFAEVDWQALSPAWLLHRTRAAYYLSEGNVPECLAEVSRAEYTFPKHLPVYAFEHMLLKRLHRQALDFQPPELSAALCQRAAA